MHSPIHHADTSRFAYKIGLDREICIYEKTKKKKKGGSSIRKCSYSRIRIFNNNGQGSNFNIQVGYLIKIFPFGIRAI